MVEKLSDLYNKVFNKLQKKIFMKVISKYFTFEDIKKFNYHVGSSLFYSSRKCENWQIFPEDLGEIEKSCRVNDSSSSINSVSYDIPSIKNGSHKRSQCTLYVDDPLKEEIIIFLLDNSSPASNRTL